MLDFVGDSLCMLLIVAACLDLKSRRHTSTETLPYAISTSYIGGIVRTLFALHVCNALAVTVADIGTRFYPFCLPSRNDICDFSDP